MKHAEVVIARRAVEEGRGLVVIVNKMDLLRGKHKSSSYEKVLEAVPQEIQTIIPQVCYVIINSTLRALPKFFFFFLISDYFDKKKSLLTLCTFFWLGFYKKAEATKKAEKFSFLEKLYFQLLKK